jgi:hypothetical protein
MGPLDLVQLTALMECTSGGAEVGVGLIDGPVLLTHPELASDHIREVPRKLWCSRVRSDSIACMHGTLVAGILLARRGSTAPAICPVCNFSCALFISRDRACGGDEQCIQCCRCVAREGHPNFCCT